MISLTPQQLSVIKAPADNCVLVQAGPGSGKTEVVARRLGFLTGECRLRPDQILVLSFSRSAVKALIRRIRSLESAGEESAIEDMRFLSVRTFDSWAFRMLRFLGHDPSSLLRNEFDENIKLLLKKFDQLDLEEVRAIPELRLGKISHFIIDEYQDLSGVRATLVKQLLKILVFKGSSCGFTILGDPDQAIYDWSIKDQEDDLYHTSGELIAWIKATYPSLEEKKLGKNHRCNAALQSVVKRASKVLQQSESAEQSAVTTLRAMIHEAGGTNSVDNLFDRLSAGSPESSLAVLCRGNSEILNIAASIQYLSYKNNKSLINYKMIAGTPPRPLPPWIATLFYKFQTNQISKAHFTKIFRLTFPEGTNNAPCAGDVNAAWRLLLGYARQNENGTTLDLGELRERIVWPDSLPDDEGEADSSITITTIHQSKGLEYNTVQIVYDDSDCSDEDVFDEEGRVLFVGMSRARSMLSLLDLDTNRSFRKFVYNDGHIRWYRWLFGKLQMELGCDGDLNSESIIRSDLMGGNKVVESVQKYLKEHEYELTGKLVVLERTPVPDKNNRYFYKIVLQEDPSVCLGFLNEWVTKDLLKILPDGKKKPPANIYNLRIGAVTTIVSNREPHYYTPSPWRDSRLWLSVCIHGIGQFKVY